MSPGPTFDRVYLALKDQLMSGSFAPGDHLEPATIGADLNSSITPVRDALHRLVGERMVEAPRNDGFRVPAPTEAELRDLYDWLRQLLELALRRPGSHGRAPALRGAEQGIGAATENAADLFRRVARRSGSDEHQAAVEYLNDRLAALRIAEGCVIDNVEEELAALRSSWEAGDFAALRRGVAAYHRRRQRCVPEILVAARSLADRR